MQKEFLKRILSSIILIPFVFFIIIQGSYLFNILIFLCLLISLYEWKIMSHKKKYQYLGYLFLLISFFTVYKIRNEVDQTGLYNFLFIIIVCISTDIGGFVFGKILKGPKLTKISPSKTYAGVVGSYILSIVSIKIIFSYSFILIDGNNSFNLIDGLIVLILSTVSQIGDIIVSYFKRLSNLKHTGNIIPGHGGILDRIDGMIFVYPFFYIFNLF